MVRFLWMFPAILCLRSLINRALMVSHIFSSPLTIWYCPGFLPSNVITGLLRLQYIIPLAATSFLHFQSNSSSFFFCLFWRSQMCLCFFSKKFRCSFAISQWGAACNKRTGKICFGLSKQIDFIKPSLCSKTLVAAMTHWTMSQQLTPFLVTDRLIITIHDCINKFPQCALCMLCLV